MTSELIAFAENSVIGRVLRGRAGKLSFRYGEDWRNLASAYPLSLSMPLAMPEYGHERINSFLWGLLPENETVLDKWARKFQTSAGDAFGLLAGVGEDCAGAAQFLRPERLEELTGHPRRSQVEWLTKEDVGERLRRLRQDHSAWRSASDTGQFSLAGAQPKTALLFEGERWGIPSGRIPTTHILKPPTGEWDGHAENEHMCLQLAYRLGLLVTRSSVQRFAGEVAIVIERYDRLKLAKETVRVHQEDMCQALGLPPTRKYESDGGPGIPQIVTLLRDSSTRPQDDVSAFLDAIALNWLIAGTDAHAKNYSLLIGTAGEVRLAPLYDIASILPYDQVAPQKIRLAMKIGGNYRLRDIGIHQWTKLATALRVKEDRLVARLRHMASAMPDEISAVHDRAIAEGLAHSLMDNLRNVLQTRARDAQRLLQL